MTTYYERRGNVAVLQIDNPPVNGLGHATRKGLIDGLGRALNDKDVQAIVITGTGKVFSGGADIKEFNTPAALGEPNLLQVIDNVERSVKPVIAAVNVSVWAAASSWRSAALSNRDAGRCLLPEVKNRLAAGPVARSACRAR
jgi:3-hydroxyacyl-CoA dehydrogenase